MNPEDYPSIMAYCRAIKEKHESKTNIQTIQGRYFNQGIRDELELVAPVKPASVRGRQALNKSPWRTSSPAIARKATS